MTLRPWACDSSTSARISSRLKAGSLGPWPAREEAPPVVAHLMTSAPARIIVRTTRRTSSTPLATPAGSAGSSATRHSWPDGLTRSPIPPMGEMIAMAVSRRGPWISPSATAARKPASRPPASRTVV